MDFFFVLRHQILGKKSVNQKIKKKLPYIAFSIVNLIHKSFVFYMMLQQHGGLQLIQVSCEKSVSGFFDKKVPKMSFFYVCNKLIHLILCMKLYFFPGNWVLGSFLGKKTPKWAQNEVLLVSWRKKACRTKSRQNYKPVTRLGISVKFSILLLLC